MRNTILMFVIMFLTFMYVLFFIKPVNATYISNCTEINVSGYYELTNDINTGLSTCFNITANNVTIDCNGFLINSSGDYIFYINRNNVVNKNANITLKNCNIVGNSNLDYSIYVSNANYVNILDSNISIMIGLYYSDNDNLINITMKNITTTTYSIFLNNVNNTILKNILIDGNYGNVGTGIFMKYSNNDTIVNTRAINSNVGLNIYDSNMTKIYNSTFKNNSYYDVEYSVDGSYCNSIFYNVTGSLGLPIVFFNKKVKIYGWNDNVSEIILCNSSNSIIKDVSLYSNNNNYLAILLSNNVTIDNVNIHNMRKGIYVKGSDNFTMNNINSSLNSVDGIEIYNSNNGIINNTIANNNNYGIRVISSKYDYILNTVSNNNPLDGIILTYSNYTKLYNITSNNNKYGIGLSYSNYNKLYNITSNNNKYGILIGVLSSFNLVDYSTFMYNTFGIYLLESHNVISNTISSKNVEGIVMDDVAYNVINDSYITLNSLYGIYITSDIYSSIKSEYNKIYNNIFNNTYNVYLYGWIYGNYWNTTETASTNIIGENEIGGNFWANPKGTGFSETCPNANHDSFCDSPYKIPPGEFVNIYGNNTDYLPLRYYNYPPEIKYVNLTILGFGTKNNFTITSNITDRDSITDADYMCFLNSCIKLGPTNTTELMDISDVFNTTSSDYVFVNDTYGASTDYQLYYSITNNSFNTDVVSYLDNQTIYKNDTICNLGNDKISYYINYSSLGGNVHAYNSRGVLLPSECKNVSAVWNGDWIYENISSEHVDPNYPLIANETVHTYFVITTNNTLFNFGNISVNVCRPGWTQNTSYISVPVGTSKYYIGCSKNGVIVINQSNIVLNANPILGVIVNGYVNGYYEVNITNNDNLLNYSNVKVITNLPYPFVNTTPYTFNVNLTTSEKLTKFVYIRGKPVTEVGHLLSFNAIPSYKKYTYYAEIKVLNDGVSKYPVTYLINKSILEDFGKRNPALDKYFVDGKSNGVIATENSTYLIITVETNFTHSSLHLGTHYITYTYYVYDPFLVGGGGSPPPKIEINPEKLNITINYPNLCNESIINVTWYGNPQEAKIHLSKNIIKFVKSPMDGEKIWLNKHTVVPIKICIPREFVLNKTSVNIINGYMDIESQGTYGEVSDRLFITVHFNASNISNIEIQKTKVQPYIYIYAGLIILFVLLLSVFF